MTKRKMVLGNIDILKEELEYRKVRFIENLNLVKSVGQKHFSGKKFIYNTHWCEEIAYDKDCWNAGAGIAAAWEIIASAKGVDVKTRYINKGMAIEVTFM